jgi:hypothetical protein
MQFRAVLLLAAACVGALADHPIVPVIALLKKLAVQAEEEGKTEALANEKYEYWCKTSLTELSAAIAEETEAIASLEDKIAAGEERKAQLEAEIKQLGVELVELDEAGAEADKERAEGKANYAETFKDLSETLAAVEEAIAALEKSKAANFLQVVNTPVVQKALNFAVAAAPDTKKGNAIAAFLQQPDFKERPDFEAEGDRAAHVQKYEFKSGDIIETLKTLSLRFQDEITAANKAETNAINSYDLSKQAREEVIVQTKASMDEKKGLLASVMSDLASDNASLESEKSDLAADEKSQAATDKACMVKKQEWEERSSVRTAEIEAIEQAIKILATATGVRDKVPENPVPPPSPALVQTPSFLQLNVNDPRAKALALVRAAAKKTHSSGLARFAQELSAHLDDPFVAVTNMIEKMIFHLMDEQRQEDEHKAWCDTELHINNVSKVDKETKIADLTMKIDSADAFVVELTAQIGEAEAHIADIVAYMKEATEIREIGKKENKLAIDDAKKAQSAIADAEAVIEAFYKESGMIAKEAWEDLLQTKNRQPVELTGPPDTWGASYTGVADPKAQPEGIISVLQAVASEFATMEADTAAQDATDQAQYEEDIKANEITKAERETQVSTKSAEKSRQVEIIESLTAARKHTSDELYQVNLYLEDLIPACVAGDSTYEDRKAAREEEEEALRQAQNILADAFKVAAPAPAPASFLAPVRRHQ